MVEENVQRGQEQQAAAHARKSVKRFRSVHYAVGDEVLLFNSRKRGRKGRRLESDFLGPYTIKDIFGKKVTLKNNEGKTLSTTYNLDHLKPYRRPEISDSQKQQMPSRPSVICYAPKIDPPTQRNESTPARIPTQVPSPTEDEGCILLVVDCMVLLLA